MISTIVSAIKSRVQSVLTSNYQELAYANDVAKNTWKGNDKRFAVLPKHASEANSVTGYLTIDQEFQVIITDGFINLSGNDSIQQSKVIAIQEIGLAIYKDLVKTKAGASVIAVSDLNINETQFSDNTIIQSLNFKIKYRTQI